MELVTGATGYIGGRLIERLVREGRPVRATSRDPGRLDQLPGVEGVRLDAVSGKGLDAALDGCTFAYYLVHSMEPSADGDFSARDRRAAENFARAAQQAGVEKIVYLGGLAPGSGLAVSPHLHSRLEVERILLEAVPRSTAFRASIMIGARSAPFRLLVRLVERLRFLPFPEWSANRTRPIDERDGIEYLARAPFEPAAAGRSLDIGGPDVLSYAEIIEGIAEHLGVRRTPLHFNSSQTSAASAVVAAIVDEPIELVRPLMVSLETDLLPRNDDAREIFGLRLHSFDRSVDRALADWEREEELTAR
jgi:uncharacterized protein YbjT (DUF2867 family)